MKPKTKETLYLLLNEYFRKAKEEDTFPTFSKLAVYLESSKRELMDILNNEKHKYNDLIKDATNRIESILEDILLQGEAKNIAGCIFALKQPPFNWADKRTVEVSERRIIEIVNSMTNEQKLEYCKTGKVPNFARNSNN